MVEEDKQLLIVEENLPASNDTSNKDILDKINSVATKEDLQEVASLFNLNITKKEMTRALQQDELLDLILQQAGERLRRRPDEISTTDLLAYMNAFKGNIEKTQNYIDRVEESPAIQYNDNKNVTVTINNLNRDSSENVIDFINDILKQANSINEVVDAVETIDVSNKEGENNDTDE